MFYRIYPIAQTKVNAFSHHFRPLQWKLVVSGINFPSTCLVCHLKPRCLLIALLKILVYVCATVNQVVVNASYVLDTGNNNGSKPLSIV